jgi:stage V sporulation protein R
VVEQDSRELDKAIGDIFEIAAGCNLDPFRLHFELVPANIMYEFGAYGLPSRFSHWTHGRTYQELRTMYQYGLNKIYELVINTDPCYAFLLESNSVLQNKLVVAHVIAHADFFKNNIYFQQTSRDMLEGAAVNAERIQRYEFRHGRLEVERFMDAALAIQEHVDPDQMIRSRREAVTRRQERERLSRQVTTEAEALRPRPRPEQAKPIPPEPEKDILLFLMEYAEGLDDWQRDILGIVRAETLYFLPQMRTKIMNEGWASLWHARIMRQMDLSVDESIEFARLHANVLATSERQINPYLVGLKIFEDIERRWDNPTQEEREVLGREPGQGLSKIFEVRETESDISFLRNYLTRDLMRELDLHIFRQEGEEAKAEEKDWEEVRDAIVAGMVNFGNPYLMVENGDHEQRGELYIKHLFEGQELDLKYAERTMPYLYQIWKRPVHIETVVEEAPTLLTYDSSAGMTKTPLQ